MGKQAGKEGNMNPMLFWGLVRIHEEEIRRNVEAMRRARELSSGGRRRFWRRRGSGGDPTT